MRATTGQYLRADVTPSSALCALATLGLLVFATSALAQTAVAPVPAPATVMRLAQSWRIPSSDLARRRQPQPQPKSPTGRGSWQVEFAGGAVVATTLGSGDTGVLPPAGSSFTTSSGGRTTRRVSSWYFGDGAQLLNDALAATPTAPASARLVPLDSVLVTTGLAGRIVPIGGLKVVRAITPRYAIEAGLDFGQASLTLSQQTLDQIEISRASYVTAFDALLGDPARFTNPTTTTTASFRMGGGYRANLTGAVRISLPMVHDFSPYVVLGGGGAFNFGHGPGFTLTGNYTFTAPGFGTRVWDETDQFMVTYRLATARPVGVFGAGIKREFSRGRGIIIDGRVHVAPNGFETVLEARPTHVPISSPGVISTLTSPSVQFSSSTSLSQSSLQTTLKGFSSHSGSMTANTVIVVRYYIRY